MKTLFVYDRSLCEYRLSAAHPMQPERFGLAVDLLRAWGLGGAGAGAWRDVEIASPPIASDEELASAHSPEYVRFVKAASVANRPLAGHGIGLGDTPAFSGMHEAAASSVGASVAALSAVMGGTHVRACNLAGGMHHAAHDHASGFCIYNDAVVAIKQAQRSIPSLRVAYVDIDAHHGDGVEAGFYDDPAVLTVSVHESGRYLFPGTGGTEDNANESAVNVPLPMGAGPDCHMLAFTEIVLPALKAFRPHVIVAQGGADSHRRDPLTHLCQTVGGYAALIGRLVEAADSLCEGRFVLLGGGGYRPYDEVPRMWAAASCLVFGIEIPAELPADWLRLSEQAAASAGAEPCAVTRTLDESGTGEEEDSDAVSQTRSAIEAVRRRSPLLASDSAVGAGCFLEEQLADLVDRELDAGL